MKKLIALIVLCSGFVCYDGFSAARVTSGARGGGRPGAASAPAAAAPSAAPSVAKSNASGATSARAAVRRGSAPVAVKTNASAPAAAPVAPKSSGVTARAASQKAINSGTKISSATENTVVSEECKTKYYGCMDSFCMVENTNGGRCLCSDRHAELETVLEEIQKLDEQSYAMATTGVERIEMGDDAEAVEAMVKKAANAVTTGESSPVGGQKTKARSLDLSAWNNSGFDDDEEQEALFSTSETDELSSKKGNALYSSVNKICVQQIPECASSMSMLKMMYAQQIKADCGAYENSLKKQKSDSAKKLQTAQKALKDAALEQHQNANKYDLGQCTIRFKQCMQTTAGCGEDFSKCASVVGSLNAQQSAKSTRKTINKKQTDVKMFTIKGVVSEISIAAATYDTLLAKKPMCESVTKQCVNVKDKVWDTFLTEAAPELKSAELIAESNIRMNCIGNISECFQKACKDNMDPNDPEGSYDMCLSRPDTVRSLCKVQIDPCVSAEPQILDYVYSRLASMRVDACTKEVKKCLTAEDRCGADYANCVGLDTDTIITKMCPAEKLTACNVDEDGKTLAQNEVFEKITTIISGIMLNIDNNLLTTCQNAANESMAKVCGDTQSCETAKFDLSNMESFVKVLACKYLDGEGNNMDCKADVEQFTSNELFPFEFDIDWKDDDHTIAKSVKKTKRTDDDAKNSYGVFATLKGRPDVSIIGLVEEETKDNKDGKLQFAVSTEKTASAQYDIESTKQLVKILNTALDRIMNSIESDPKVQFCMTGRDVQGIGGKMLSDKKVNQARFPNLTNDSRAIVANSLLSKLSDKIAELETKYTKEMGQMDEKINQKIAESLKQAASVVEAIIDDANKTNCEGDKDGTKTGYGQNVAYKNKMSGSISGGGWCTKKISAERGFTYNIASYDAATNVCTVETKRFDCTDWRREPACENGCRKYDNGTVKDTHTVQMFKFQ